MRQLILRLLYSLLEAVNPEAKREREQYEAERAKALAEITRQAERIVTLEQERQTLVIDRANLFALNETLKRAIAELQTRIGQNHTAGRSDDDILRAPLPGANS
jgi:predicted RNase H-like nuclease (RuvC/YqgF family)